MKIGISPAAVRFSPPAAARFLPPNSRLPAVIPANAGIHFYRQTPAFTSLFTKKCAENSKINRPEWIPAFAGMTAFFCGIPPIPPRSREWNVLFPVVLPGMTAFFLRKTPGFAAVNCCGLFRPRQMSGTCRCLSFFFADSDGRGDFFGQISAAAVYN